MSPQAQGRLFVVANAGRSGSTFLWALLKANAAAATVLHEDIPVQITRPRQYNRAYEHHDRARVLQDPDLAAYLHRWETLLEAGDVIETGWTVYHLLPVLHDLFHDRLHLVVLHRDPWSVALSRANMGNYHPRTWYDNRHEVSPHDPRSIAPEYVDLWQDMNHAEKCMYWWYVVYREIDEFIASHSHIPNIEISAYSLFQGDGADSLSNFLGASLETKPTLEKNPVQTFMLETFPVFDEYRAFGRHDRVNSYAMERFGYVLDVEDMARLSSKYRLPPGVMPRLRHSVDYWSRRRRAGQAIRALIGR